MAGVPEQIKAVVDKSDLEMENSLKILQEDRQNTRITTRDEEGKVKKYKLPEVIETLNARNEDVRDAVEEVIATNKATLNDDKEWSIGAHRKQMNDLHLGFDSLKSQIKDLMTPMVSSIDRYKDDTRQALE